MYAVIRPALRSSSIRSIRGRRYLYARRYRSLHTTRPLAQSSKPPSKPDSTSIKDNDAKNESRESAAPAGEQPGVEVVTEDADAIAQKLQRSKEMTRRYSTALRRTQKRNPAPGLPPVHIPDWFYRNVRLREDASAAVRGSEPPKHCVVSIKPKTSEHSATCMIPFKGYARTLGNLSHMTKAMWPAAGLSDEHMRDFARDFLDAESMEDQEKAPGDVFTMRAGAAEKESADIDKESKPLARKRRAHTEHVRTTRRLSETTLENSMSPLVRAEIRATIAACLTANQPAITESFPSIKSNVILQSPSDSNGAILEDIVQQSAIDMGADVISFDALDVAQIAGDYLGEGTLPSPNSIRSLGFDVYSKLPELASDVDYLGGENDADYDTDPYREPPPFPLPSNRPGSFMPRVQVLSTLDPKWMDKVKDIFNLGDGRGDNTPSSNQPSRIQISTEEQLQDLKLTTLLEALVDSNILKRDRASTNPPTELDPSAAAKLGVPLTQPEFFDYSLAPEGAELDFSSVLPVSSMADNTLTVKVGPSPESPSVSLKPKIIHVRDIKELNATEHGGRILQKLEQIVRKKRNASEHVILLGTTSSPDLFPELSQSGVDILQSDGEASFFRTIVVPDGAALRSSTDYKAKRGHKRRPSSDVSDELPPKNKSAMERSKFRNINLRHIADMLSCLDPASASHFKDTGHIMAEAYSMTELFPKMSFDRVLSYDEVHRIAITALGLHVSDGNSNHLNWAHVILSMGLLKASDEVKFGFIKALRSEEGDRQDGKTPLDLLSPDRKKVVMGRLGLQSKDGSKPQLDMERIKRTANKHEKNLLHGIADADQIKTTFDRVHVPKETIEAIRTLTSLSLLRPDAFNYGVLATDKISGALLYGPPGTGKTLLAKAVAKESGSTVLEVSGSEINDKYVGEGEKNVRAIFSLARKLSPCIVFLDEADAIFGSRDGSQHRVSHRDILNQFLKEWDGLNDQGVFVMVASNRPFDLDDAVIRRLPRRLLVDLPKEVDREKILAIHLRDEQLDVSVNIGDLAKRTPLYSGSDLKNLAISAALACVREENEQAAIAAIKATTDPSNDSPPDPPQLVRGQNYSFPERRTLQLRHFEKALQEVSASISEDMSSLNAIKKFDEQYGNRKGTRKKKAYGFGVAADKNEDAARVRT
ncbi:AAA-domain-containing protein [Polyplosphaeria fusca]|uniref:AAA-domain-containing protein n=1 Tax=Polyplosphaeria fusca TaxID=682080 RepID=A0A9P4QPM3_9PLEO|nr:AAA-domain-containing protein [Polyplosphaeria fusca]